MGRGSQHPIWSSCNNFSLADTSMLKPPKFLKFNLVILYTLIPSRITGEISQKALQAKTNTEKSLTAKLLPYIIEGFLPFSLLHRVTDHS